MKTLIIKQTEPARIDIALAVALGVSRAKAQKAIKAGLVLIEGKTVTPHFMIEGETQISYDESAFQKAAARAVTIPEIPILYEDDDVLVVNKPAGILVHPTEISNEPTLVDAILAMRPEIAGIGENPKRPGIVHRLDREASGVLIIAKSQAAFAHLKEQFKNREVQKHYTVLVHGHLPDATGTITFPIARSKQNGRMAARPNSQDGRPAITHYDVVKKFSHHSLLDVRIETGRTHQIRAHMFAMQTPVAGDTLYAGKKFKLMPLGRLFLHAASLTVKLLNDEVKTFTAPLPQELEDVLETLPL